MAPLAGPDELVSMPGVDPDAYSEVTLLAVLDQATSLVIGELGWDPRESERTYRLRPACYGTTVFLPALNVTAVAATVDDGDVVLEDTWWYPNGEVNLHQAVLYGGTVTYTAGWPPSEIPQAVRDACLMIAVQQLKNPDRVTYQSAGPLTVTYAAASTPETSLLAPYRIVAVA